MPENVRIEDKEGRWILAWDPVPGAESYYLSTSSSNTITQCVAADITSLKNSRDKELTLTIIAICPKGLRGEEFYGYVSLPERTETETVSVKKKWNLLIWLVEFKPSLPKIKNPFSKLPPLPSMKINWSRFMWKKRIPSVAVAPVRKQKNRIVVNYHIICRKLRLAWKHRPRPAFNFQFKLALFKVSPKLKAQLKKLFIRRTHQTKQKQKSLLEKLIMKISKWTWAYRSLQYVCQRWLAVLLILTLMVCTIMWLKKPASATQAIVQPPSVVATNAPQVAVAQPITVPVPMVFIPMPQAPTIVTRKVYIPTPAPMVAATTYVPAPTPRPVQAPPVIVQAAPVPEPINRIEITAQEGGYEVVVAPGKEAECFFPNGYDIIDTNARSKFRNTETYEFKINGKPADRNIPRTDKKIRSLGFHNTGDTDLVITFVLVKTPEKPGLARKAYAAVVGN